MVFFIKKCRWLLLFTAFILTGCGFHLQNKTEMPEKFKKMTFYSMEPYSFLSREVKSALLSNGVILLENQDDQSVPSLRLMDYNLSKDTVSIYQDGKAAEYQLILNVNAQVIIANHDIYPITVKIFRSFFDNPAAALAKDTEQNLLTKEMYQQAAAQLVRKLKAVNIVDKRK